MALRLTEVVIDCADHGAVVDFWAAAMGYERREVNEQYVALVPPAPAAPGRPPLLFQKVPEPKVAKNRVHLDLRGDVMADEVARLVGLGATGDRRAIARAADLDGDGRSRRATSSASRATPDRR